MNLFYNNQKNYRKEQLNKVQFSIFVTLKTS